MKKKITAAFLAAAMMISTFPAMAADDMESALVAVKSRIDVPQELTEFRSQTVSDNYGTQYMFVWRDKESKDDLTVSADDAGHISSYRYYAESEAEKEVFRPRSEYYAAAESFLKKAAPELFSNDDDHIVNKENNSVIRDNTATLSFERQIGGIPVVGNDASVTVKYKDGAYTVISCNINWDYKTQISPEDGADVSAAGYYEVFPLEMVYRKPVRLYYRTGGTDDEKVELIYRFKAYKAGYVGVYTHDEIKPDSDRFDRGYATASGGGGAAKAENAATDLTPQERAEVTNVAWLKPAESIIASLDAMNAFGALPSADKYSKRIYKQGKKYFMSLDYSSFNDAKDEIPVGVYITADGQTGELIQFYKLHDGSGINASPDDAEKAAARAKISDFMTANFSGKLAECGEPEEEVDSALSERYPRYVSGVKYVNNYMGAIYDTQRGIITGFNQVWDDDVSEFTDPSKAIKPETAQARMEEYAPVHKVYVKSGDEFRLCYTSDGANTEIDAVSGDRIKPKHSYDDPEVYSYSDISGHWAESVINSIAQYGAGLPGDEFLPDKEITQSEFLGMLSRAMGYGFADVESLYQIHKDLLRDGEAAPDAAVLREDAFVLLIRFMGYEKIAGMDIFQPGFNDGTDVSPEKSGALAILRGYGIVEGDAGSVRPRANLTRAEAAALIYNYLTKA